MPTHARTHTTPAIVSGGQVSASGLSTSQASRTTSTVGAQAQPAEPTQRYALPRRACRVVSCATVQLTKKRRGPTESVKERMVWMETCPGCGVPVAAAGSLFLLHLRLCCPDILERLLAEPHNARAMLRRPHVRPFTSLPPSLPRHTTRHDTSVMRLTHVSSAHGPTAGGGERGGGGRYGPSRRSRGRRRRGTLFTLCRACRVTCRVCRVCRVRVCVSCGCCSGGASAEGGLAHRRSWSRWTRPRSGRSCDTSDGRPTSASSSPTSHHSSRPSVSPSPSSAVSCVVVVCRVSLSCRVRWCVSCLTRFFSV
jgi:hypothetical protein